MNCFTIRCDLRVCKAVKGGGAVAMRYNRC